MKRTSPGIDEISSWILRGNAHNLADAITHLFNLSISQCYFPSSFKTSVIRPIPKVSNPMNRSDFRPISVTPILSRVFERIVYHNYVSGSYNAWINDSQFGFRKGCSTEQAVIKLQNDCIRFRNQGYDYARIFALDMSKAFDKISHHSIINALMSMTPAINPFIVNLIRSFLSGRNHCTQVNGVTSSLLHTNQGVPQGTVGGPYLYNAGSDDVITTNESRDHAISAFADDTTPCIAGSQTDDNSVAIITGYFDSFRRHNLSPNLSKCKEIRVFFNNVDHQISNVLNITLVTELKVLGFTFDDNLSFRRHVQITVKKAYCALYQIYRLRHMNFSPSDLKLMYESLVLSRLCYGLSV